MNLGDSNTNYFHNTVKVRRHKNRIKAIKDLSGNIFTKQSDIDLCFLQYYKEFWSSSSSKISDFYRHALPDDLSVLSDIDREFLTRPISMGEVFRTLKSMSRGKSLGLDGMNMEFYLFYWNLLGIYLFNAISCLFNTGSLPHSWGKTYVVLIPKISHPISVKDFRPISLCNICYKMISKILANHLKLVIHNIIGPE